MSIEPQIAQWRAAVQRNRAVDGSDVAELEEHLRDELDELTSVGLSADEAFLVAVKRLGSVDQVTAEFARAHGDRLWKQLVLPGSVEGPRRPLVTMLVFALVAAVGIQVARIASGDGPGEWLTRDLGLFVLPVLVAYFAWVRRMPWRPVVVLAAIVVVLAVAVSVFPFSRASQTEALIAVALPVLLWFVVGVAYLAGQWRVSDRRMDFVRFTGEWAIYYVLIALGGGVLVGLMSLLLGQILPGAVITQVLLWVVPSGATASVIVAAWLVEEKKSVIENIAPVLTAIFTPLFAIMLVVAAVGYLIAGIGRSFNRDLLVGFDVLLLVVLALVLYGISARDSAKPRGVMDGVRLVAICAAVVLDILVLISLFARVGDYGFTANRVAALGLNLVLLANLLGTAWFTLRLLAQRGPALAVERWQTGYLPVFGVWAAAIVLVLPVVFGFA